VKKRIAGLITALALGTLAATTAIVIDEATTATLQDTGWGASDTTSTPADTGWGIAPTDGAPGTVTPNDTWWG
jgi:hypothetical protein